MLVTIPDPTPPIANGTTIIRIVMGFGRRALPQFAPRRVCTVAVVIASRRAAATAFGPRRALGGRYGPARGFVSKLACGIFRTSRSSICVESPSTWPRA
jgi:hypothetical protein